MRTSRLVWNEKNQQFIKYLSIELIMIGIYVLLNRLLTSYRRVYYAIFEIFRYQMKSKGKLSYGQNMNQYEHFSLMISQAHASIC